MVRLYLLSVSRCWWRNVIDELAQRLLRPRSANCGPTPYRFAVQELSERPFDDVLGGISHPGRSPGTSSGTAAGESLLRDRGTFAQPHHRREPRLSRRPLSHRRHCRLGRGNRLGAALLVGSLLVGKARQSRTSAPMKVLPRASVKI